MHFKKWNTNQIQQHIASHTPLTLTMTLVSKHITTQVSRLSPLVFVM